MFKLIKSIVVLFLVLLALIIGSATVAVVTIDPNDFKPQITQQVKKATGRDLTLTGDIGWSFYPWVGLNLGEASLANADGFGSQPFAEIDEIDIKVKLLPLLKSSLQARQILIRGAALNLQKNAQGKDNWSDLAKSSEKSEEPADKESSAPQKDLSIRIDGVKIIDAKLRYRDEQSGSDLEINPLNLSTGSLEPGKPVKLSSDLVLNMPDMNIAADLSGTVTANPETGRYQIKDLELTQTTRGNGMPENGITSTQKLNLDANTNSQQLSINPLSIESAGLTLDGQIDVKQFIDNPKYNGHFKTNQFSPKELMLSLGMAAPITSDKKALDSASLEFNLEGTKNNVSLRSLEARLDDSTLSGDFSLTDFTNQFIQFDLVLDQLNVDRYLPEATVATNSTAKAETTTSDKIELPLEILQKLNINGSAKIETLLVKKLKFSESSVSILAKNGKIQIDPLTAKAYNGNAKIYASLDTQHSVPAYQLDVDLSGVRSEEILETLFGERYITGSAGFKAKIATDADSISGLQKNLNGNFNAEFLDGTIKGSKLSKKINEARNFWRKLAGKAPISEDITEETKFSSLTGSGKITKGIVTNQDLKILAPVFQANGEGKVDLPAKQINYTLSLSDDDEKGDKSTYLPLQIIGPFDDLSFRLRADSVLKERAKLELDAKKAELKAKADAEKAKLEAKFEAEKAAKKAELEAKAAEKKAELEAKVEKKKSELKEKVDEQKQDLEKKLQDELKNKLKGLF